MRIRKAIIPVAGMGTRFLPATKAQPKEMLTVVDKPVIQYIVEEAVSAGIEEIIFVTALGKRAIEDHFDRNFELEFRLEQKQKLRELEGIQAIGKLAKFAFVRQQTPMGDGHALLAAHPFIGKDEAVAVLFGDDIISGEVPAIGEMIEEFERRGSCNPVVALQEVSREDVRQYGIVDGSRVSDDVVEIHKFIEKPSPEEAPSCLAAVGRYVLTPEVFTRLLTQSPGKDGEIRLADAFSGLLRDGQQLWGRRFSGKRYDCGNKLQFLIAQIELGCRHPELGKDLSAYLKNMSGDCI